MSVFQDILRRIAERVEGARAISLVGVDGIAIDTYGRFEGLPIESVAAELGAFVKNAQSTHSEGQTGTIQQLTITTERVTTILSRVTPEYYLLLLLSRDGNLGRGRVELRRAALSLEKELL